MDLLAQPPLRANAEAISHQQHPDKEFRINRRAACIAVKRSEILADSRQVNEAINRTQHVNLRDVIVNGKLIKQCASPFLLWTHHRKQSPASIGKVNQQAASRSKRVFNKIIP
jgi:hypothetical protein